VVEQLALGHEPDLATRRVRRQAAVDEVDVPDVVDSEQDAALARHVLVPGDADLLSEDPEARLGGSDHRRVGEVPHQLRSLLGPS
jgi:hypothetical protein